MEKQIGTTLDETEVIGSPPAYPEGMEREFVRFSKRIGARVNARFSRQKVKLLEICKRNLRNRINEEKMWLFLELIYGDFERDAKGVLTPKVIYKNIERAAKIGKASCEQDWQSNLKQTFGDGWQKYYHPDGTLKYIDLWKKKQNDLFIGLPEYIKRELKLVSYELVYSDAEPEEVINEIQKKLDAIIRNTNSYSKDEVTTFVAQINRLYQQAAGCDSYIWTTARDERVRECHRALDGKKISWDNPPPMWRRTKQGTVYTGQNCHPGEDYCCRCVARPVFGHEKEST